jgi:hypothetical protein
VLLKIGEKDYLIPQTKGLITPFTHINTSTDDRVQSEWEKHQYVTQLLNGEITTEEVIRGVGGYATTSREKKEFEERQQRNLEILEKSIEDTMRSKT